MSTQYESESHEDRLANLGTPLARLCRYYLACISHDGDCDLRRFVESRHQPEYAELTSLPPMGSGNPWNTPQVQQILRRYRNDRHRLTLYVGYPTRLFLIHSRRSNWQGYMLEPLLTFEYQVPSSGSPQLVDERPEFNLRCLGQLTGTQGADVITESIRLQDAIGLSSPTYTLANLPNVMASLVTECPHWPWQEPVNLHEIGGAIPLCDLNVDGLYNRAILLTAERPLYTRGLETELNELQCHDSETYGPTSLGHWLGENAGSVRPTSQEPIIEVLPLNTEQREAVRRSLHKPLSVITGPPGTGKSQVVTSIVINCAWNRQSVLVASKNNQAVDVVEARVNAIGPRPLLLRLGASQYQNRLSGYLAALLGSTTTPEDVQTYEEARGDYDQVVSERRDLHTQLNEVIELRNQLDKLSQMVEPIREQYGDSIFRSMNDVDCQSAERDAQRARTAAIQATKSQQSWLVQMFWALLRKGRFAESNRALRSLNAVGRCLGLDDTPEASNDDDVVNQHDWVDQLIHRNAKAVQVKVYFQCLDDLDQLLSPSDISTLSIENDQRLAEVCERMWRLWLQLQPSTLDQESRRQLGDYRALLDMIVQANERNEQVGGSVIGRFREMFPLITSFLPAWAVTNLSARRRIPLEPGFFDVVVIDEASQCDIASALPLLFRAKRVVVIGDPQQLRHITQINSRLNEELMQQEQILAPDLGPRWSYTQSSLFDFAASMVEGDDVVSLRDHHRSHAEIIGFSNETFYEGRLRIATRYDRLRRPEGPAIRWLDVQGRVVRPRGGSAVNEAEAKRVVEELRRLLLEQRYDGTVGVVTPFRAQANRIRDLVDQDDELSPVRIPSELLIDTVYRFQGDERDVMLFSPVVSADTPATTLGFLATNPNTFNVAVTRARAALIAIGDLKACAGCGVDHLARFANYCAGNRQCHAPIPDVEQDLGPNYPTSYRSPAVSQWEEMFYERLYESGLRPIPQFEVEQYYLDLALFAGERRLDIEIDGERYHRDWDGGHKCRDQIRSRRLIELGWDVMRFWVYQVRDETDRCVDRVLAWWNQHAETEEQETSMTAEVSE